MDAIRAKDPNDKRLDGLLQQLNGITGRVPLPPPGYTPKDADPLADKVNAAVGPLKKSNNAFEDNYRALTSGAKTGWGDSYDKLSADLENAKADEARMKLRGEDPKSQREYMQRLRGELGGLDREFDISRKGAELGLRRLGETVTEDHVRYEAKIAGERKAINDKLGDGPKELTELKTKVDAAQKKIAGMKTSDPGYEDAYRDFARASLEHYNKSKIVRAPELAQLRALDYGLDKNAKPDTINALAGSKQRGLDEINGFLRERKLGFDVPMSASDAAIKDARRYIADMKAPRNPPALEAGTWDPLRVDPSKKLDESSSLMKPTIKDFADTIEKGGFWEKTYRGDMAKTIKLDEFRKLDIPFEPTNEPRWPYLDKAPDRPVPKTSEILKTPDAGKRDGFQPKTLQDYSDAFKSGKVKPSEVVGRMLETADKDPNNAFIPLTDARRTQLRAWAKDADDAWAAGTAKPLQGILIPVKSQIDIQGLVTDGGVAGTGKVAAKDAEVVARLRAQGAEFLHTRMDPLGAGLDGINPGPPPAPGERDRRATLNAFNDKFTSGGSSGGAATAVAYGFPVAIGSDAGGSTRNPAANQGQYGMIFTHGRVPSSGNAGDLPVAERLTSVGIIGASWKDVASIYPLIAGPSERDINTQAQPQLSMDGVGARDLKNFNGAGKPMTVGYYKPWLEDSNPEIRAKNIALIDRMKKAGTNVVELPGVPGVDQVGRAQMFDFASELADAQRNGKLTTKDKSLYPPGPRIALAMNEHPWLDSLTQKDVQQAQRVRTQVMDSMDRVFKNGVNFVITPAAAELAPPVEKEALRYGRNDLGAVLRHQQYSALANMTGLPSATLPLGYANNGLPIGTLLTGAPFREAEMIEAMRLLTPLLEARKQPRLTNDFLRGP